MIGPFLNETPRHLDWPTTIILSIYLLVAQELKAKYEAIDDGDRSSMQNALHGSIHGWVPYILHNFYYICKSLADMLFNAQIKLISTYIHLLLGK